MGSLRIAGARIGLKALDLAAFAAALAVIALVSVRAYTGTGREGIPVAHLRGPTGEWILPLDGARTVAVPGPLGETVVRIENGAAKVLSSPCKEKICVRAGAIARPGQWTACLPNRVFLRIQDRSREPVDAYSY